MVEVDRLEVRVEDQTRATGKRRTPHCHVVDVTVTVWTDDGDEPMEVGREIGDMLTGIGCSVFPPRALVTRTLNYLERVHEPGPHATGLLEDWETYAEEAGS